MTQRQHTVSTLLLSLMQCGLLNPHAELALWVEPLFWGKMSMTQLFNNVFRGERLVTAIYGNYA